MHNTDEVLSCACCGARKRRATRQKKPEQGQKQGQAKRKATLLCVKRKRAKQVQNYLN